METPYPGPDISQAPLLRGVSAALHVISLTFYGTRMYTRIRPTLRLGLDDAFITAAVLADMVEWILLLISTTYGLGRHNYYVPAREEKQALKFLFISQPPFPWAMAFTKISIACMLLRIHRSNSWAIFLYIMIAVQVLWAITANSFQFSLCKPLEAVWDPSIENPKCIPKEGQISIYVTAAITILTDVIFSLLPLKFIVHIQRPLREKIALSFVMCLGLLATVASIVKTTLVKDYGVTGDTLVDGVGITLWSIMEMQLGIISACVPCLKNLFEKFLSRLGVLSRQPAGSSLGYSASPGIGISHQLSVIGTNKRMVKGDTQSEENILPYPEPHQSTEGND